MKALKTTWNHIRRSPYQTLSAVIIMFLTFFVITLFTFLVVGSTKIIQYFESVPRVTAFFKIDAKTEDIASVRKQIDQSGKAAKIKFVSKEEALKLYTEQNKDDPLLLEMVSEDILPSSLEISTYNIADLPAIYDIFKKSSAIQRIIYQKDVVSRLTAWTNALRTVGAAIIIVLIVESIFVVITIIGIRISYRKDEIEILRLIGATNWYIRWPFVYEGMLYGIIGAVCGFLAGIAGLYYASPFLQQFLEGIPLFPIAPLFLLEVFGIQLGIAILLGSFASSLAVLRYLKD